MAQLLVQILIRVHMAWILADTRVVNMGTIAAQIGEPTE